MNKMSGEDDYLDLDKLLKEYAPLIHSVYKKFSKYNNLFYSSDDFEDLESQVNYEFIKLCTEYDPTRGVDFPGFIKFHLQQRVYHWITKYQTLRQKEHVVYMHESDDGDVDDYNEFDMMNCKNTMGDEDASNEREFRRVEAMASINYDILNPKQQKLVSDVLYEGLSLEEIAENENVELKDIQNRFYDLCSILNDYCNKNITRKVTMRKTTKSFTLSREPIVRKPIKLEDSYEQNRLG